MVTNQTGVNTSGPGGTPAERVKIAVAAAAVSAAVVIVAAVLPWGDGTKFRVVPVRGEVYYKGKPLAGATVTFSPQAGVTKDQRVAISTTDEQGGFDLKTYAGGGNNLMGAQPGEYRCAVSKFVPPGGASEDEYRKKAEAEAEERSRTGKELASASPRMVELISPEYTDLSRSKLTFTVAEGETNTIKIEIP